MTTNNNKITKLLQLFQRKCKRWNRQYPNYDFIFNKHLLYTNNFNSIKYILIGDNPGKEEKDIGEYFVDKVGIIARLFFERFLVNDFNSEVLTLNKSAIYSYNTKELTKEKRIISQKFMACLVFGLYKSLPVVPIIICGYSGGLKKKKYGSSTSEILLIKMQQQILSFMHYKIYLLKKLISVIK